MKRNLPVVCCSWRWGRSWGRSVLFLFSVPSLFFLLLSFVLLLFSLSLSVSAWCWSLMTKNMAKMCWLDKANFSPSMFLYLLYAPVVFFFFVPSPQSFSFSFISTGKPSVHSVFALVFVLCSPLPPLLASFPVCLSSSPFSFVYSFLSSSICLFIFLCSPLLVLSFFSWKSQRMASVRAFVPHDHEARSSLFLWEEIEEHQSCNQLRGPGNSNVGIVGRRRVLVHFLLNRSLV